MTARSLLRSALVPTLTLLFPGVPAAGGDLPRVTVETTRGAFVIELDAVHAPEATRRFLARSGVRPLPEGLAQAALYAGSQLCESRAHGYLVFGCLPYTDGPARPRAPHIEPPVPDEIDGRAMGLEQRRLDDPFEIGMLWQRELMPRYLRLREDGKPVPPGLEALVDQVRRGGAEAAAPTLAGHSMLWLLETAGFRFTEGASAQRVTRGSVAWTSTWPGESDERFLVALDDLPERDGRTTVFGRVIAGQDVLEAIAAIPVDKLHRPKDPVLITNTKW